MYIATNYETDNSVVLTFSVAIYIGYNGEFQKNEVQEDPFIPEILLPSLKWFNRYPCPRKQLIARFVTLTLLSGDILQIAYPFKPGSPNWFTFWEQLQSPEIISVKGFGEKVTDKFLKTSLGLP